MNAINQLKVEIFVPLDTCACMWSQFIDNIFRVLTPFMKYIDFETKNINSEEARNRNIYEKCVIIRDYQKFTASFNLKRKLPQILKEEGLIEQIEQNI